MNKPKILALDIETFPMELLGWGLYDQNFGLNQIKRDWVIASWAGKFLGESKVHYQDVSKKKNKRDEKSILQGIWNLINDCDVLLTQNGKSFDIPKLYAKFIEHGLPPLADKEHIDTKRLAKGKFKFTSNSLEYLCKVLKTEHQKLKHTRFPGMDLWTACLAGNKKAWKDMQKYNKHDVLCLEDLFYKFRPWGIKVNLAKYVENEKGTCSVCAGTDISKWGFAFKGQAKYQKFHCNECGALTRGKENLLKKSTKNKMMREL